MYRAGTNKRPVPLEHNVYYAGEIYQVMSGDSTFNADSIRRAAAAHRKKTNPDAAKSAGAAGGGGRGGAAARPTGRGQAQGPNRGGGGGGGGGRGYGGRGGGADGFRRQLQGGLLLLLLQWCLAIEFLQAARNAAPALVVLCMHACWRTARSISGSLYYVQQTMCMRPCTAARRPPSVMRGRTLLHPLLPQLPLAGAAHTYNRQIHSTHSSWAVLQVAAAVAAAAASARSCRTSSSCCASATCCQWPSSPSAKSAATRLLTRAARWT